MHKSVNNHLICHIMALNPLEPIASRCAEIILENLTKKWIGQTAKILTIDLNSNYRYLNLFTTKEETTSLTEVKINDIDISKTYPRIWYKIRTKNKYRITTIVIDYNERIRRARQFRLEGKYSLFETQMKTCLETIKWWAKKETEVKAMVTPSKLIANKTIAYLDTTDSQRILQKLKTTNTILLTKRSFKNTGIKTNAKIPCMTTIKDRPTYDKSAKSRLSKQIDNPWTSLIENKQWQSCQVD